MSISLSVRHIRDIGYLWLRREDHLRVSESVHLSDDWGRVERSGDAFESRHRVACTFLLYPAIAELLLDRDAVVKAVDKDLSVVLIDHHFVVHARHLQEAFVRVDFHSLIRSGQLEVGGDVFDRESASNP